ncbi:hypothetical protein RM553_02985 [Zunongwangia sp. F363]|uniref:Secreted protein n=1 Tax=Autumnicola tepida TaxID=3075595 RepID=A0ABU3C685_9FLAO|nr:hypothetical protein [Zunongwangia sp. F363]MDT0641788.1 hypothetical protein [Zunongwangia sp. F363]
MKNFIPFLILLISAGAFAQIEIPRTTNSGTAIPAASESKTGNFPAFKLKKEEDAPSDFLKKEPKKLDFRETKNDLLTAGSVYEKKWKKDKEAKAEYKNDQYLGDFKTGGKFVELYCRDHEYVDGDKVRISVNGTVVEPSISLGAGYHPILITLVSGMNNIEFEALNQGSSGPNTAELRVFDENGEPLARKEWNLLTGAKASLIVVKNQ